MFFISPCNIFLKFYAKEIKRAFFFKKKVWCCNKKKLNMAVRKVTVSKSGKVSKKERTKEEKETFKRKHRQSFRLNDLELKALMRYFRKYKINNRAKFLRETIMSAVLKRFEEDYPTLFEVEEKTKIQCPTLF